MPRLESIGIVLERTEARFIDGSRYTGSWNELGLNGTGRYVLPHGVTFRGEFRDGAFHGEGSLYWARGQRLDAVWSRGKANGVRYRFSDGLIFHPQRWSYCRFPDRRFHISAETRGLSGDDLLPPECYDLVIGFFDPSTGCILSYADPREKVIEIPTTSLVQWIKGHCRKAWTELTGHRPCLHENWFALHDHLFSDPCPVPEHFPFPDDPALHCWWKRLVSPENLNGNSSSTGTCLFPVPLG